MNKIRSVLSYFHVDAMECPNHKQLIQKIQYNFSYYFLRYIFKIIIIYFLSIAKYLD